MQTSTMLALGAGVFLLMGVTAAASVYVMENMEENETPAKTEKLSANTAQSQTACDDDNIVGKVIGGVGGGLLGSQIGSGSGNTAATIGGSVGGTILGEEYIPTKNVTC